jgi:hypothetical protein
MLQQLMCSRAIWKVIFGELLTKQGMKEKCLLYTKKKQYVHA